MGLAVPVVKRFVRDIVNPPKKMSTVLDTPTGYRQKNWLAPQRNVTVSKRTKLVTLGNQMRFLIGHFRVASNLIMKARVRA